MRQTEKLDFTLRARRSRFRSPFDRGTDGATEEYRKNLGMQGREKSSTTMFYFHRDNNCDGAYHWHHDCRLVPFDLKSNPDWLMSNLSPSNRGKCKTCIHLDAKLEMKSTPTGPRETVPAIPGYYRRERPKR